MTVKKSPNKAKPSATSTKLKNAAKSLAAQIAVSKPSSAKAATERAAKTGTKPSGGRASKAEPQPMTARAMFASLSLARAASGQMTPVTSTTSPAPANGTTTTESVVMKPNASLNLASDVVPAAIEEMAVDELTAEDQLINIGRERGFVTYDDILGLFPDAEKTWSRWKMSLRHSRMPASLS